ncbi:MAG: cell wall hydrolase [Clostridia bacterium]|nr:cell wall hydrolase [Clostridia bacterium]
MKLRSSKAACYVGAAIIFFAVPVLPAVATTYEKPQNTDTGIKVASYSANTEEVLVTGYEQTGTYKNKAVAFTDPYLDVFDSSDEESAQVVGRLYTNTLVDVELVGKEWTKITSGNCSGYVQTQALCFGDEAEALVEIIGTDNLLTGYTNEEVQEKEAAEEAARLAEEARIAAEEEARRAAAAAEEARRQKIIQNTISGTDITYNPTMSVSDEDIWILACIIDWESAYQPYAGKLAVANVVLNRVRSSHYPNSISGVVYQRSQFSGASNGAGGPSDRFQARLSSGPRNTECMQAALEALSGVNNIGGYTSFRALYTVDVNNYSDFVIIGDHIFH